MLSSLLNRLKPSGSRARDEGQNESPRPLPIGDQWGFLATDGSWFIAPRFSWAGSFRDGYALTTQGGATDEPWTKPSNGAFTYVDLNQARNLQDKFSEAEEFNDGFALVNVGAEERYVPQTDSYMKSGGAYFFINPEGQNSFGSKFDGASSFSEGLAAVKPLEKNNWGCIDATGKLVIPAQFNHIGPFSGGFAVAVAGTQDGCLAVNTKFGVLGKDGQWVIKPSFSSVQHCGNGLFWAHAQNEPLYRCVSVDGKTAFEAPKNAIQPYAFSENLALAYAGAWTRLSDGAYYGQADGSGYGYLSKSGEWAIAPTWLRARNFKQSRAAVQNAQGYWGFIDEKGKALIEPSYLAVGDFDSRRAWAIEGKWTHFEAGNTRANSPQIGRTVLLDLQGKQVWNSAPN